MEISKHQIDRFSNLQFSRPILFSLLKLTKTRLGEKILFILVSSFSIKLFSTSEERLRTVHFKNVSIDIANKSKFGMTPFLQELILISSVRKSPNVLKTYLSWLKIVLSLKMIIKRQYFWLKHDSCSVLRIFE